MTATSPPDGTSIETSAESSKHPPGREPLAIVVLATPALVTARRIAAAFPGARVHGLHGRVGRSGDTPRGGAGSSADDSAGDSSQGVDGADLTYAALGPHLRALYARGTPIVALCAAGIVIRCLAGALTNKGVEPPVLAVADDASAVVPLLGGLAGVNQLARAIATVLGVDAAITTSGELRFGTCLLNPPDGYALADLEHGKHFVSDLLGGATARVEGAAPWLATTDLPLSPSAELTIRITPYESDARSDTLVIHSRSVVAAWHYRAAPIAEDARQTARAVAAIRAGLRQHRLAAAALAAVVAPRDVMGAPAVEAAAAMLGVPVRYVQPPVAAAAAFAAPATGASRLLEAACTHDAGPLPPVRVVALPLSAHAAAAAEPSPPDTAATSIDVALAISPDPIDPARLGVARGRLCVVGLGPGRADWLLPAARAALDHATDILGYATYVTMAGPFRDDQRVHASDNREELARAAHAFRLAADGRDVVIVSSGDPGVFAMAAAVFEVLDDPADAAWARVALRIIPGVSAAMATAAYAGAPLGHDFCVLSLSDNLKPWSIIETRLRLAAQADLVMAFYNPVSRARPWQLDRALAIVREHRLPETRVVLGRDVGRPGGGVTTTTLGALRSSDVDMRTTVIIGSSTTRGVVGSATSTKRTAAGVPHGEWIYTPRSYPE